MSELRKAEEVIKRKNGSVNIFSTKMLIFRRIGYSKKQINTMNILIQNGGTIEVCEYLSFLVFKQYAAGESESYCDIHFNYKKLDPDIELFLSSMKAITHITCDDSHIFITYIIK